MSAAEIPASDPHTLEANVSDSPVVVTRDGGITRITLNRPRAINALSHEMFGLIEAGLATAKAEGSSAIVLDGAGERGFCGGGDVKAMRASGPEGARALLRDEYRADYSVATSSVPVVGIMDGITMGGGIGIAGHAALRIVTERSRLAMPEVRIGIAPDVGGHLLLARAPGRLGELLAVTAGSFDAGDAIALGFADAFVASGRIAELRNALADGQDPQSAVDAFASPAPVSELLAMREWFDPIAEAALEGVPTDPVTAAVDLLEMLELSEQEAARAAAIAMRAMCPVSLAVTLFQLARTRTEGLDLAGVLRDDMRVLGRLIERADFSEGVRAQLIDRDGAPEWQPETLDALAASREARAELAAVLDTAYADGEEPLAL